MTHCIRRLGRFSAGFVLALSTTFSLSGVATASTATSARPAVSCTSIAPVFHRIPVLGARFGEISEYNFSYCLPREDSVRVLSASVRDGDGRAWRRAALDGPTYGRRAGWVPEDYLARGDLPAGARVSAGTGP